MCLSLEELNITTYISERKNIIYLCSDINISNVKFLNANFRIRIFIILISFVTGNIIMWLKVWNCQRHPNVCSTEYVLSISEANTSELSVSFDKTFPVTCNGWWIRDKCLYGNRHDHHPSVKDLSEHLNKLRTCFLSELSTSRSCCIICRYIKSILYTLS